MCGSASAALEPLAPAQGVAVLGKGVVWADEGRVLFQGLRVGRRDAGGKLTLAAR